MANYRDESERRAEVVRWRASGQTMAAYCASHGMSEQSLRRWRKELDGRLSPPTAASVRVELPRHVAQRGLMLEVGRVRLRVEPGFDGALLREVIKTLSAEAT